MKRFLITTAFAVLAPGLALADPVSVKDFPLAERIAAKVADVQK
ncbi:MAG: hypothetical protein ACT4OK_04560 [Gemmobacter sp.]